MSRGNRRTALSTPAVVATSIEDRREAASPDAGPLKAAAPLAERQEKHSQLRESVAYRVEAAALERVTMDFLMAMRVCATMAGRSPMLGVESMLFGLIPNLIESNVAILVLPREGALNPARRELRYALENSIKCLYVDQRLPNADLGARIAYLDASVPRSSVSVVDNVSPFGLTEQEATEFRVDVKSMFGLLSAYAHPSDRQIMERLSQDARGASIGFETPRELRSLVATMTNAYDLILVVLFSGIGLGLTGDLVAHVFDEFPNWTFYRTKYVRCVTSRVGFKIGRTATSRDDSLTVVTPQRRNQPA